MSNNRQYLKKLNYDVILKRKGSNFVVFIPELSCIAEDASLEKAYKKLEIEKEKYFKDMIESDLVNYINEPESLTIKKTFIYALFPFIIRSIVIFIMIFLIGLMTSYMLSDIVKTISHQSVKKQVSILLRKIDEMPHKRKEEIRQRLLKTIKQLKPFTDEFKIFLESYHEDNSVTLDKGDFRR